MAALTFIVVAAMAAQASAQVKIRGGRPVLINGNVIMASDDATADENNVRNNVFLPADRSILKQLAEAKKLIAASRYGEAVRNLDAILEMQEDYFFQPEQETKDAKGSKKDSKDGKTKKVAKARVAPRVFSGNRFLVSRTGAGVSYRTLKSEAQRLIGQMPREGRDLYELQFGDRARQMLNEALASGDPARLSQVSWRYFHTRSGYQATFLLGLYHFDHGQPLAGAATLERLRDVGEAADDFEPALSLTAAACWLRADLPTKAAELLTALRQRQPRLRISVAGREVPIFADDSAAVAWLKELIGTPSSSAPVATDQWLMFRGNAARTASAAGGEPLLSMQWHVAAMNDSPTGNLLRLYQKMATECGNPMIPAVHPLAVGDMLLMRTPQALLAVDFVTGKLRWASPDVPPTPSAGSATGNAQQQQQQAYLELMQAYRLSERMWKDLVCGTLSSDGDRVFTVEDSEAEINSNDPNAMLRARLIAAGGGIRMVGNGINGTQPTIYNRLAAYEISTGKLKWRIGGPAAPRATRQADTFFLGPPLPSAGQLYALAEKSGEIRLLALDAATGDQLWSQQLALAEPGLTPDSLRCSIGASPSSADGILVCPTSAGAVVAVDLATHSLLWGYQYDCDQNFNVFNQFNAGMGLLQFGRISYGEDFETPTGWLDGSVSICNGRVLLTPVESNWLYCLSLADGKLLWKAPRGGDWYVACVDRENVTLAGRRAMHALRLADGTPAWGGRAVPFPDGAAIVGRGFLSENRYFLPLNDATVIGIDVASGKIAQTSKCRRGTVAGNLLCHAGRIVSVGIDGIDAYYQLSAAADEAKRRLAADAHDADATIIRGEILLQEGRRSEAVAAFRRAVELDDSLRPRALLRDTLMDGLRTDFTAYRGRTAELEKLLDNDSERIAFLGVMAAGLRRADESAEALKYYLKLFELNPNLRSFDTIDKSLTVERNRWFRTQLTELRREAKGEAADTIDQLVASRLRAAAADGSIERLQRFWDCFGGLPAAATVRDELVRRLNEAGRTMDAELTAVENRSPSRAEKEELDAVWPVGKIEAAAKKTNNNQPYDPMHMRNVLELRGRPSPFFRDSTFRVGYNQNQSNPKLVVTCRDGVGRERWSAAITHPDLRQDQSRVVFNFNPYAAATRGYADGHLLVASLGGKLFAVDTLGKESKGVPRVLWIRDSFDMALDGVVSRKAARTDPMLNLIRQQIAQMGDAANSLGMLRHDYFCFQRFRSVTAINPRNGETLWVRQDIPPNSLLFGDDDLLFVLPPNRDKAMVLRATDGEQLGTCKVPRGGGRLVLPGGEETTVYRDFSDTCLGTVGRNMLLWWPEGNDREMAMSDPWEGRDVWHGGKFAAASKTCIVNAEAVGVMEPSGHFVLISLADGRNIADLKLDAAPRLQEITLLGSGDQYFLVVASAPSKFKNFQPVTSTAGHVFKAIPSGRLYAIDGHGKLQWPAPAVIESQCLLMNGPARLPVLAFASQIYDQQPNGVMRARLALLCIDKRNGRIACKKSDQNNGLFNFNIVGNVEKKTIDVSMPQSTMTLTFTDKPLPPVDAANADESADSDSPQQPELNDGISTAILKALRKALQPNASPTPKK